MRWSFLLLLIPQAVFGGILLSEDFESGSLADGNWQLFGTATNSPNPQVDLGNGSSRVVQFGADVSGGDLFSNFLNYAADPDYVGQLLLTFDFLWTDTGSDSYIGTDHSTSTHTTEEWLWSSANNGTHPLGSPAVNTWTHVSFAFTPYDPGAVGTILVKLEQNSGVPGTSFFDNVVLQQ